MGFELMTSSLPRMRSTPELHRLSFERGRRIELPFPAWKAGIIAIIRTPPIGRKTLCFRSNVVGGGGLEPPNPKERIYSPPQLPLCDPPKVCPIYALGHQSEPMGGFEPSTPRLQITCSGQLSYIGSISSLSFKRTAKIRIICDSPKIFQSFSKQIFHPCRKSPILHLWRHA